MRNLNLQSVISSEFLTELKEFFSFLLWYFRTRTYKWFVRFELFKDTIVDLLYKKRGRYVRPFLHLGTIGLIFFVITVGPLIFSNQDQKPVERSQSFFSANGYGGSFYTQQAEEVRQYRGGEIITHTVAEGETLSSIAERYSISVESILWENDLSEKATIKPGQELSILPVDGVRHKVTRGETVYTIGKKYGLDNSEVQVIVDYPFNEFLNDETFALTTGQYIVVPGGEKPNAPKPKPTFVAIPLPQPGALTGNGSFVWPASGRITQYYSFYHKAIDIANSAGGPILAADSGTVIVAGWPDSSGYGNRVIIDHGNGFVTLYAHLRTIQVSVGQTVNRGDVIGQMGNTGRSTGTHLHFEIRQGGGLLNPLSYL